MDYYCTTTRASLVAQMVMNLPAMQETWVRSLGREDTLEKGMAIHSRILAWREVHGQRKPKVTVHGAAKESDMTEQGSPVHGILQARILEWVAIPFSKGSS